MNQKLIERVGIDRSTVTNFDLVGIDFERLQSKITAEEAIVNTQAEFELVSDGQTGLIVPDIQTGEQRIIKKLELKAYDVGYLSIQWKVDTLHGIEKPICKLAVNVTSGNNNLQNLTVDEYKQRLNEVFELLATDYGIYIDYSNLLITEIEINVTVKLDKPFREYRQCFDLIRLNMANRFRDAKGNVKSAVWYQSNPDNQTSEIQTIYVSNNDIELKLYNKVQQLIDTCVIRVDAETDMLRVEYKVMKPRALKNPFGDASISALTDEKLKQWFHDRFYRDIASRFYKWHEANLKQLADTLRPHVEASRYYINPFIRECRQYKELHGGFPLLFDIEDLRYALKAVKGSKNLARRFNAVKSKLIYEHDLVGNLDKMTEILNKVMKACK